MQETQAKAELKMSYNKTDFKDQPGRRTFPGYIEHWAETRAESEAFVFLSDDGGREAITREQLRKRCTDFARTLISLGVKQGDIVGVTAGNSPQWLYAVFGAMFAGAIPACVPFTMKDGSDAVGVLNKLRACSLLVLEPEAGWNVCKTLLTSYNRSGSVTSNVVPSLKQLLCTSLPDGETEVLTIDRVRETPPANAAQLPVVDLASTAVFLSTSGSTGIPKLVRHTYGGLTASARSYRNLYPNTQDRFYNDRPFSWIGGFPFNVTTTETRILRSSLAKPPADPIQALVDSIKREQCSTVLMLPPVLKILMNKPEGFWDNWPCDTILTGGMPVSKQYAECIGSLCKTLVVIYAGTEFVIGCGNCVERQEDFTEYSCGVPVEGREVKVVDENGDINPSNKRGEIYVKGFGIFSEYFNEPEKTKAAMTEDGWYKTDDIGYMNGDGCLFVEGRKSEIIVCGGINVSPTIMEAILKTCPGVGGALVVPIPDESYFQQLCVCVIRQPGSDVSEESLRVFCEEQYNDSQGRVTAIPKYFLFVDSFPMTSSGKPVRKLMTDIALKIIEKQ